MTVQCTAKNVKVKTNWQSLRTLTTVRSLHLNVFATQRPYSL
jgi:hypothetical protein